MKENNQPLEAPKEYWELTETERKTMLNKCGPDGLANHVVPNHLLGTNISQSCDIHDFTFVQAKNQSDQRKSDKLFLKNMGRIINSETDSLLVRGTRKALSRIYYLAVRIYSSFQKDKKIMKTEPA